MQCNTCLIDFKRDSIEDIKNIVFMYNLIKLQGPVHQLKKEGNKNEV